MTCNLRTVNSSLQTVRNFTGRTNCTDRKSLAGPLYDFTGKAKNILSVANDMQFTDRKTLPYEPKAKFTDRYSAGILDNPHVRTCSREVVLFFLTRSAHVDCDWHISRKNI